MPTPQRRPDEPVATRPRREVVTEPFVPALDLFHADAATLESLSESDRHTVLEGKVSDVTHFYLGLESLPRTLEVARDLVPLVRAFPSQVRGQVVQPGGTPVDRVSVEPTLPGGRVLGRGVVTGGEGVFTLPLPRMSEDDRSLVRERGLGLRIRGANGIQEVVRDLPPAGGSALGVIELEGELTPLPRSVVDALVDLVGGLGDITPGEPDLGTTSPPVQVKLGQDACGIVFEEDTAVRRFGYKVLVRLVEPRTTTVSRVGWSRGGDRLFPLILWNPDWGTGLGLEQTSYVDRVPIDKPIGVDRFRDGIVGLSGDRITADRSVPVAGTLGLGYVLNLAQVWKYQGLTLGDLVYSLPLAPGEQQRIAVSERTSTASVRDAEVLDVDEQQRAALREDTSANAVFTSAFEEHVTASSRYSNEARSSSWGVAGGIGAVLGPVAIGVGAGGGSGKSSNSGSTASALDGVRTATNTAAEDMHRTVESEASGRRRASRSSIRLARETETQTVTTKVITNHNKAHALTIQYWEVLRKFAATTEVEGAELVCFVPLDIVRFLPAGEQLQLTDTEVVNSRSELLDRYALLHKHADAIQPWLPGRHREGLRLLEDFCANPRQVVAIDGPASDSLQVSLRGTVVPYETVWVTVLLRGGRRLPRVALNSSLTEIEPKTLGSEAELVAALQTQRNDTSSLTTMSATVTLPPTTDRGEVVGFEIERAFRALTYQLDMTKNPTYQLMKQLDNLPWVNIDVNDLQSSVTLSPSDLERHLGGPQISDFSVLLNGGGASIAADDLGSPRRLLPGPTLVAALEQNNPLRYRDLLKIERTLQHVVGNTLTYSKAVWSSLTAEERVVMLEGYTIGLPDTGLDVEGINDASQHIPLLSCVANQVLGYYGNCMILPFSIPAALAVKLAGAPPEEAFEGEGEASVIQPLTTGAVQDALTAFHRSAFAPPVSHFTLPTRGVLGEAVLGNCPSAEKIDLTRFWNWQDSPGDEATAIEGVTLRDSTVAQLAAPSTLTGLPSAATLTPGQGGTLSPGTLAAALAAEASKQASFSTDFLGHDVLKALGEKTIGSAESARADALGKATQMASQAMTAAVDVHKSATAAQQAKEAKAEEKQKAEEKAAEEKKAAEKKAAADKLDAAVKNLKDNAKAYLGAANARADLDEAKEMATGVLAQLTTEPIPTIRAITLFDAYSQEENGTRTQGSTAWLTVLGLLPA